MNFKRIFKLNYLLMWKNVKSRRAHPCLTCLEISLPLVLIVLIGLTALIFWAINRPDDGGTSGGDKPEPDYQSDPSWSSEPSDPPWSTNTPFTTSLSTSTTHPNLTLNSSTTSTVNSSFLTDETETEAEDETDYWTSSARPDLDDRNDPKKKNKNNKTTDLSGITVVYSPKNPIIDKIIGGIPRGGRFGFADIKGFDTGTQMNEFCAEMVLKYGDVLNPRNENRFKMIGVEFKSGFENSEKKFSYIIRPSKEHMKNKLMIENNNNAENSLPFNVYETSGFLILQKYLDEGILRKIESSQGRSIDSNENETTIQDFDYTVYNKLNSETETDSWKQQFGVMPIFFQVLFCVAFISVITITITGIVNEKEAGLQEFLEMNGIPKWIQILQWFINSFIVNIFIVIIVTITVLYCFRMKKFGMILLPFHTMFIAIFCYILAATAYSMLIASFFHRATIAAAIGSLIWLASFLMFWKDLQEFQIASYSVARQVCTAFIPNMALFQIFTVGATISMETEMGMELQSTVSPWAFIGMMLLSTFIFTILALYFQQIMPSDVGIPKPWHFIFTDFKCCTCKPSKVGDSAGADESQKDSSKSKNKPNPKAIEPDPTDLPVGIKIQNLHKKFGKKNAVDGLTLKIYRGQITALLGHNGAGKTTTISILIGSLKSTSGKAYLDEMDIGKDMAKIRNNLGFCPQHNVLFRDLKGRDQLIFYAALKGESIKASKQKVIEFGERTNLTAYFNKRPDQISGGQKRQLQLGIALISNPSIVILDEPTSGMDPETRRSVWGVLQDFRKDRTIILTTHHMEEADALGDRIAIMSMGQVQCVGTSNFLKNFYGDGYNLKMNIKDSGKKQEILDLVKTRFPKAKFGVANSDHELIINIPDKGNITEKMPGMFRDLTEKKKELRIVEIGFTHSTIEDVFIKVGELSEGKDEDNKAQQLDDIWIGGKDSPKVQNKGMLFLQRFYALLLKRAKVFSRSYGIILVMIIVPLLFIIFGFLLGDEAIKLDQPEESLEIQPSLYKDNPWRILYKSENSPKLEGFLKSIVGESNAEAVQISLEEKFRDVQSKVGKKESQIEEFKHKYIFGVELLNDKIIKGFISKKAIHSAPLVQNIFSNMRIKSIDPDYSIDVTSKPMDMYLARRFHTGPESKTKYDLMEGFGFAALVSLALCLISACFIIFPGEEKVNQLKHLQIMSGISPVLYHLSNLFWDLFIVLLIFTISIIVLYCIDNTGTYTSMNGPAVLLLIMVAFCLCLAVFAYLFRYPKDKLIAKEWLVISQRGHKVNVKYACICSDHFLSTDYYPNGELKPGTIPSLFKNRQPETGVENSTVEGESERFEEGSAENWSIEKYCKFCICPMGIDKPKLINKEEEVQLQSFLDENNIDSIPPFICCLVCFEKVQNCNKLVEQIVKLQKELKIINEFLLTYQKSSSEISTEIKPGEHLEDKKRPLDENQSFDDSGIQDTSQGHDQYQNDEQTLVPTQATCTDNQTVALQSDILNDHNYAKIISSSSDVSVQKPSRNIKRALIRKRTLLAKISNKSRPINKLKKDLYSKIFSKGQIKLLNGFLFELVKFCDKVFNDAYETLKCKKRIIESLTSIVVSKGNEQYLDVIKMFFMIRIKAKLRMINNSKYVKKKIKEKQLIKIKKY